MNDVREAVMALPQFAKMRAAKKVLEEALEPPHEVTCALFPDPYDERDPVGPCTCKNRRTA